MDVARGLDKMHSRHIIHLDLKSPNILLTAGDTAKIAVLSPHLHAHIKDFCDLEKLQPFHTDSHIVCLATGMEATHISARTFLTSPAGHSQSLRNVLYSVCFHSIGCLAIWMMGLSTCAGCGSVQDFGE